VFLAQLFAELSFDRVKIDARSSVTSSTGFLNIVRAVMALAVPGDARRVRLSGL
jgi:hypothetical protein